MRTITDISKPVNDYDRQILDLVSLMGETLLLNGAEISRVHTTMEMVAAAYHKDEIDVYAISNGIFVTLRHDDRTRCTNIKHVPLATPDLGKVTQINALSRKICEQHLPVNQATEDHCAYSLFSAMDTSNCLRCRRQLLLSPSWRQSFRLLCHRPRRYSFMSFSTLDGKGKTFENDTDHSRKRSCNPLRTYGCSCSFCFKHG